MQLTDLEARLDQVTTDLLPELRTTKNLNGNALAELLAVGDELERHRGEVEEISRQLVGKLWFIFTAMLTEAEYAQNPKPILNAAWSYQDRLSRFFGPSF